MLILPVSFIIQVLRIQIENSKIVKSLKISMVKAKVNLSTGK